MFDQHVFVILLWGMLMSPLTTFLLFLISYYKPYNVKERARSFHANRPWVRVPSSNLLKPPQTRLLLFVHAHRFPRADREKRTHLQCLLTGSQPSFC